MHRTFYFFIKNWAKENRSNSIHPPRNISERNNCFDCPDSKLPLLIEKYRHIAFEMRVNANLYRSAARISLEAFLLRSAMLPLKIGLAFTVPAPWTKIDTALIDRETSGKVLELVTGSTLWTFLFCVAWKFVDSPFLSTIDKSISEEHDRICARWPTQNEFRWMSC